MAWNEPGGNKPKDPWGGGGDQGPPDLDEALKNLKDKINSVFGGGGGNKKGGGTPSSPWPAFVVVFFVAAIVYGLSGFYLVDQREKAVVLQFGKFDREVGAGLNWRAPLFEHYEKVDVQSERIYEFTEEMLTRDTNIVSVTLQVQFRVNDAKKFVLEVASPEEILKQATSSAVRHVVGASSMDDVLKDKRESIPDEVLMRLKAYLDAYHTGIELGGVVLDRTEAPSAVRDAFDDVSKAKEDEDRFKKVAEAYRNSVVPAAEGEAARTLAEAEAYKQRVIKSAEGDAQRFESLLAEYRQAPAVTRERLYIETMTEVYSNTSKVLVDVDNGNNMLYLPLDQLMKQRGQGPSSAESEPAVPSAAASAGKDDGGSGRSGTRSQYGSRTRELR